ncbi:MAG: acyltransferase [bacterium]
MEMQKTSRRYDLDWLRILAFALLILFHTGMMFNTWGWHVKNNETSVLFEYVMIFTHQWRMPLLFFISGAAIWFALNKYTGRKFLAERHKRLLLPLLFGMFFIIPPQVYYERLFQGQVFASFFDFYQTVFDLKTYPEGNFSWHHLWYIPYIFVYSLISFPLFRYFKSEAGKIKLSKIVRFFERKNRIFLWFLPLAMSEIMLRPFWPHDTMNLVADWAQFTTTFLIFCFGFFLASQQSIWQTIEKNRFKALGFGLGATIFLYTIWYSNNESATALGYTLYRALRSFNVWCWILAMLGFAKKHLSWNSQYLKYANEAVYPFYILHQTITVAIGFYMANWQAGIAVKFVILAIGTFGGCWLIYEGLIKRNNFMRVLFGLKPRKMVPVTSALNQQHAVVSFGAK